MTSDAIDVLAAIIEQPDDNVLRLAYADLLEERGGLGDAQTAHVIRDGFTGTKYSPYTPPYTKHVQGSTHGDVMIAYYFRGMVNEIKCDAATFLRHADELLWHRGQTVRCKGCNSCKDGLIYTGKDGMKWIECRVPRPCPETAQPISKVVLTTVPGYQDPSNPLAWVVPAEWTGKKYGETCVDREWLLGCVFEERWPGVEFELPRGTEVVPDDQEYPSPDDVTTGTNYGPTGDVTAMNYWITGRE